MIIIIIILCRLTNSNRSANQSRVIFLFKCSEFQPILSEEIQAILWQGARSAAIHMLIRAIRTSASAACIRHGSFPSICGTVERDVHSL